MHFDFEFLLVALTLVTGLVWAWDRWQRRRMKQAGQEPPAEDSAPWWIDLPRSLFPVILAVLVVRSFIVEPFRIPSGSMMPTLYNGDFILVNKFSYGLRLPVLHNELVDFGEPERGDVVVFRYPVNPTQDYIKRVVGLPGDRIRYQGKQLFINGEPAEQLSMGPYYGPAAKGEARVKLEDLGDVEHPILLHNSPARRPIELVVPSGQYFVMGDNRDDSNDSRFWGTVPAENMVGKAFMIWMSWDPEETRINWSRIGDAIE